VTGRIAKVVFEDDLVIKKRVKKLKDRFLGQRPSRVGSRIKASLTLSGMASNLKEKGHSSEIVDQCLKQTREKQASGLPVSPMTLVDCVKSAESRGLSRGKKRGPKK
jgi:hypothetical protein